MEKTSKSNDEWKKFEDEVAKKRRKKSIEAEKGHLKPPADLMVQRLSSVPFGRLKKYQPIEAREFVPFTFDDFTIENVKRACEKHYDMASGSCDVLASDRGPSCSRMQQVQSKKVFYVRFVEALNQSSRSTSCSNDESFQRIKSQKNAALYQPPSISVTQLLRAGQLSNDVSEETALKLRSFDISTSSWSANEKLFKFSVSKERFAHGSFRDAHKAVLLNDSTMETNWVVTKYKNNLAETFETDLSLTLEEHTKKQVQLHETARYISSQFSLSAPLEFGETFTFDKIYFSEYNQKPVTIEPYYGKSFVKFINNNGKINRQLPDHLQILQQKAETLAHFSYGFSKKTLMLLDIQGSPKKMKLYDPEIATSKLITDNGEILFCANNLSIVAINQFIDEHDCNQFCRIMKLPVLER